MRTLAILAKIALYLVAAAAMTMVLSPALLAQVNLGPGTVIVGSNGGAAGGAPNTLYPVQCGGAGAPSWCPGPTATADAWIRAACAALPANGGFVNLAGMSGTIAATTRGCSTPSRQVIMIQDPTSALTVTEADGDMPFPLDAYSMLLGWGAGQCVYGRGIILGPTANVSAIVGAAHVDGTEEAFTVQGTCLYGGTGATVGKGIAYSKLNYTNTTISNNNMEECNHACVWIENDGGSVSLQNNEFNVTDSNNSIVGSAIVIAATGSGTGCLNGDISIWQGNSEHANGGAAYPEINIYGNGTGGLNCGVYVHDTYIERNTGGTPDVNGIKVADCWNCTFENIHGGGSNGGTDFINVSQTATGRIENVVFNNININGSWTNIINDTTPGGSLLTQSANPFVTFYPAQPGYIYGGGGGGSGFPFILGSTSIPGSTTVSTIAGMVNFSSKIINGVSYAANYPGGINSQATSCLSDALNGANGNTTKRCDLSGLTGSPTFSTQIDIGDSGGDYVDAILPCGTTWYFSMTGGTSYGLAIHGGAQTHSACFLPSVGGMDLTLAPTSGSSLQAVVGLLGNSNYYTSVSGFNIVNILGGHVTASGAGLLIRGDLGGGAFADDSHMIGVNVYDSLDAYAELVIGVCCSFTQELSVLNAGGGGTPLGISVNTGNYVQGFIFTNGTIVDPGTGHPGVLCLDQRSGGPISDVSLINAYGETGVTDTTTPFIQIDGCRSFTISNWLETANVANSTAPMVAVNNAFNTNLQINGMHAFLGTGYFLYPLTAVTNSYTGQTGALAPQTDSAGNFGVYAPPTTPFSIGTGTIAQAIVGGFIPGAAAYPLTVETTTANGNMALLNTSKSSTNHHTSMFYQTFISGVAQTMFEEGTDQGVTGANDFYFYDDVSSRLVYKIPGASDSVNFIQAPTLPFTGLTQCLDVNTAGVVGVTGAGCGGAGITSLVGDVGASGTGAVTATVGGLGGVNLAGLGSGILYSTNGIPSLATNVAVSGYASFGSYVQSGQYNIPCSSAVTFDANLGDYQQLILSCNVTSSTLANQKNGQTLHFSICQDTTGGRTFTWPTTFYGPVPVTTVASTTTSPYNSCTQATFYVQGGNVTSDQFNSANCIGSGSTVACGQAIQGEMAFATGTNPTVTLTTSAWGTHSQLVFSPDQSKGTDLSVTCNTSGAAGHAEVTGASTPGTNVVVEWYGTIATNPLCGTWYIRNP